MDLHSRAEKQPLLHQTAIASKVGKMMLLTKTLLETVTDMGLFYTRRSTQSGRFQ